MTTIDNWARFLICVLLCTVAGAQDSPVFINLAVKLNGKTQGAPKAVTLTYGGRTVSIPVRNGRLEIPSEITANEKVGFTTIVGPEKIHISELPGLKFKNEEWTLILEDRQFDKEFQPVPSGAEVRSACVIKFESKNAEGTALIAPHCRSKIGQKRAE